MSSIPDPAHPEERRPHISDSEEIAAASTARAGDLVHTVLGWLLITLVRVHDAIGAIEIFTTNNQGGAHAWMHRPEEELLFRRGDLRHPTWCSLADCAALNPRASVHRSAPATIEPLAAGDPTIRVQVEQDSEEPLETATRHLVLTFDHTAVDGWPDVRAYVLAPYAARGLLAELSTMVDTLGGAK